ncbi:competence type IV pilus minor pilin ComGF [Bacillus swezeyi]|nr:competence type IV pilus minor pilin ComGF [Bacillus swezeyi]MEC1261154.1 competence type IV pilus minor pilin ComGF [Bacillus swezeyi]MED2929375.1 competence type IV pilus minor pilin ComGF [Bacillus swezeyi]MED2941187.1 competence type IV pilus minor pilin ComGF [Bacillus swezeyi]MED2963598.1 competence type IV pilus minor pilin ComGF [Bacillus swezeyi]MED3073696.1 competence type IV pilus minor pilin ComGF [Bacillus swezeyi]
MTIKSVFPSSLEKNKSTVSRFCRQKGFTLLNVLAALTVYMFIAGTMASIFHLFLSQERKETDIHPQEWTITAEQILKECRNALDIKAANGHHALEMTNSKGETVRYEQYQTTIRKRVNSKGHVPILQHVKHVTFKIQDHQLMIEAVSLSDKTYHAAFPIYHSA